ncbi:MAG: BsuPI-related putative proteinase inhibitor [Dehalococcoidia bacterium]
MVAGVVLALIGVLVDQRATGAVRAQPAPRFTEAALNLADPRPCIPEPGLQTCDTARSALWTGETDAWAARGVTDPDDRFNETVVFRVHAGDPTAIANIARTLGWPYLKITRVDFAEGEFVEVTNLGGGPQDVTGWSVQSPAADVEVALPTGVILQPGQQCVVYTGLPFLNPGAMCRGFTLTMENDGPWPDDAGRVVLFYDALDLLGDETRYSADPNNQPPPPNLQGVRSDPMKPLPSRAVSFTLSTDKQTYTIGEPVVFRMVLRNDSSTPETLQFPSTQDFDVVVRAGAAEVWRWSDGRAFGEIFRTLTLQPGEEQTFTATWEQPADPGLQAPPGPYQATADLTATAPITSPPVTFSIR